VLLEEITPTYLLEEITPTNETKIESNHIYTKAFKSLTRKLKYMW